MHCARALDHLVDEESWPELVAALDDPDPRAIGILESDPDRRVRGFAVGLVGRWVHDDDGAALAALTNAHRNDAHPAVRKSAGWLTPGGAIYEKTKPRVTR